MQGLFKLDKENKSFYKLLVSLCIPMIVQNLISSSVNVVDTVMISSLGESSVASIGVANQFFFLFNMTLYGITGGAGIFISQFFGKKDVNNIRRGESSVASIGVANQFFFLFNMTLYGITGGAGIFISQFFGKKDVNNIRSVTGLSTILAFLVSCLFFLPALIAPKLIINIFSHDSEVVKLCIEYFSIVAFSYPIIAISTVFSMGARSVRNPKLGMICSTIALGTNIVLNYGLILGNFGLPALGVKGAALATVIARIIELVLITSYIYFIKKDYILRFNLNDVKRIKADFLKTFASKSLPILLNDSLWAFGTVLYSVAYSQAGTSAIAASQIATSTGNFFIMTSVCVANGAAIMLGNELGADNIEKAIRYSKKFSITGLSALLAFLVSCLFFLPALIAPRLIINIFSHDSEVVKLCIEYFSIIAFSYPIIAISTVFSMGARGVRNPKLGMICSTIALGTNIVLNYGLILGNFGLPALGVKGAALATVIARIIELALITSYIYFIKKDYVLRFNLKDVKRIKADFLKTFTSKSLPIFLNDSLWAFGTVLYSVAYSQAGTSAIAASQIATSTGNFFIMTSVCVANGAAIMLGNELGADNIEKAIRYSKKFSILVSLTGLIFGLLLIANIPLLLKIFNVSKDLSPDIIKIFIIMGLLMALKAFNTFIVIGVLRSGGDTKYSLFLELGCMWLVSLPLTFLAAFKGAPIFMLVLLTYTEEIAKFIFGVPRALSKKWATNLVKEMV